MLRHVAKILLLFQSFPVAPGGSMQHMAHSDDDLVRRFTSIALRRGEDVLSASTCIGTAERKTLIETSSQEAQLNRIMIREYCQQQGLTADSSHGFQKYVITKAMTHFELKERAIKKALYEQPISITASSSSAVK